ncbi:MAG: DUF2175 family protein [Desulfurococcales archaeon]|jgi:hypothetical protein|nr:DUF2175 family protein [Desulfurococcales archaeon]
MSKYKIWKCGICGEQVIEGQRFLVIKNLGFAHLECVVSELVKKYQSISREALSLLEANEALTYAIVRLKTAEIETESDHLRGLIAAARKDLEKHSAFLGNELGKLLGYL